MKTPLRYLFACIFGIWSIYAWPALTHLVLRTCDGERYNIELADGLTVKLDNNTLEIASAGAPAFFSIEEVAGLSYAALPFDGITETTTETPAINLSDTGIAVIAHGAHALMIYDTSGRTVASRTFNDYISVGRSELPGGILLICIDGTTMIKLAVK